MLPARHARLLLLAGVALVAPTVTSAQDGYLFKQPVVSIAVRAGAALPSANDDLHGFFTRELTLDRGDFRSATIGLDGSFMLSPRVDLTIGVSYAESNSHSEFRDWLGEDDLPIAQDTRVRRIPVTAGVKLYPLERGRSLSRYAWVPRSVLPYAGAGAGIMFYRVKQDGEFVDDETLIIFGDHFESSGNAPMVNLFGGVEWWAKPRFGFTLEGRYNWSSAELRDDFTDFDRIKLHGFQLTAGVAARF